MAEVGRTIVFPTRDDLVELNHRHIQESGGMFLGRENLRNPGSLEWVLEAIQYPLYGVDLYPTLAEKAAALAWVIIAEHVFHDGCKRTGMSALEALIESGDFQLNATDDEIINVALRVAGRQDVSDYAYEDLLRWVREKIGLRVA